MCGGRGQSPAAYLVVPGQGRTRVGCVRAPLSLDTVTGGSTRTLSRTRRRESSSGENMGQ